MIRPAVLALAALLLPFPTAAQVGLPQAPRATGPLPRAVALRVDSVFAHLDRTTSPGCALGVSEGGRPVYQRGYGMADLQHGLAITPASIFHVASISKQFAAIAVALLAEEGKLSLDDDVRTHVPEVPDHGTRITVRQLIHHTSGLRDQWNLLAMAGWRFPDDLITERDVLAIVGRQRGLNFRPGDEWVYSNTGYTLLAVIVQRVSGQSLRQFAEARFFGPLGMRDTHFHDDHAMVVPGRTSAYVPAPGGAWRISIPVFDTYGATSLFTTTADLLTWMAHLDRPTIGSEALWRAAQASGLLNDRTATNYGYGLSLGTWRGVRTVGHGGADAGYRAYVERYPEHGVAVAVLCNLATANPGALARGVAQVVLGDRLSPEEVTVRAVAHRPARPVLERWPGAYRDTVSQAVLRVVLRGDTLYANGQRLEFGSDSTATSSGIPGWVELRQRPGAPAAILMHPRGLRQAVFVRQPEAVAGRAALAAFAGEYASAELDVRYGIVLRDSVLVRTHRKLTDATLVPAGRDVFTTGGATLVFQRDRRGRVTGFTVSDGRVRGVRFGRGVESRE